MHIIPLTSSPSQNSRTTLPINGRNTTFEFCARYNSEADYWVLSVKDVVTNTLLVVDLVLIAGNYPAANILEQWEHLRIGSATIVAINPDSKQYAPNADNLGTDFVLVWSDNL